MYFSGVVSTVLVLAVTAVAGPVQQKRSEFSSSVVEKLLAPPAGWVADPSTTFDKDEAMIKLRIHLVQNDMEKMQQLAIDVCQQTKLQ